MEFLRRLARRFAPYVVLTACAPSESGSHAPGGGGRAGTGAVTTGSQTAATGGEGVATGAGGSSGGSSSTGAGGTAAGAGGTAAGAGGTAGSVDAGGSPPCLEITDQGDTVVLSNCVVRITISKRTGLADYAFGGTPRVRGASASVRLATDLRVVDAASHEVGIDQATALQDGIGIGKKISVTHASPGHATLRQNYYLYDRVPFAFVDEEVTDTTAVTSNHISPLVLDATSGIDLGAPGDGRILLVPFHNDQFTRYDARPLDGSGESYEVTAVYDNQARSGLVLGSATHDTWKTAVAYASAGGKFQSLEVYGGASSAATQDTQPHGSVTGTTIRSPRIFVGWFGDWRDGLDAFGRANASLAPNPKPWKGGVVFGFNSWSAYGCAVTEPVYEKVSDFVARSLVPKDFKGTSTVFLNWDACGALSAASVAYVKNNGQRAGMYSSPFTSWGDGTDPRILKDAKGAPLPQIDGGYPLDPTNPDVKASILSNIARYKSMGYEYIKLDFMTHGIREGAHYDKTITTGVQAYNYGLSYIAEAIGDSMFVDLSISPIFPGGQYVHARRVSCDAFGGIGNSEYLMNNAGFGFWLSGTVYQYNDPDHIVLATSATDTAPIHTVEEARTRVNASAIAGTVFLDSDKLDADVEAQARAAMLLTNSDINAIARRGKAFRPLEGNTGTKAASVFVSSEGTTLYVAAFNWSGSAAATLTVDLARAGLDAATSYAVRDLWTGQKSTAKGTLALNLAKTASTIVELTPSPHP